MLSKNEIKYIQSLSHKKTRDEEGCFIAEGVKLVGELLNSDIVIDKIYATRNWQLQHPSFTITTVDDNELKKISLLSTPNEVVVLARQRRPANEPVADKRFTLVLDGIQDPGNMGTILRIADWFGVTQVVATPDTADIFNPKVVQATMGSIARVNVWYKEVSQWLGQVNVPVFGARLSGKSVYDIGRTDQGVLVIGNESRGIREDLLHYLTDQLTIPRRGGAESLNAAVATGILLSHLLK